MSLVGVYFVAKLAQAPLADFWHSSANSGIYNQTHTELCPVLSPKDVLVLNDAERYCGFASFPEHVANPEVKTPS